ncbi:MAG: shikimate kinase [bacterium]
MEPVTYALLGRYLGYSFSPQIHAALGCPEYRRLELEPEALEGFLRERRFKALNVTIPYKRAVLPYLDRISPEARKIGSVNTIVNRGGVLTGFNTDYYGFDYMTRHADIDFTGKKVLILGTGGTSFTARAVAKERGSGQVVFISRTGEENYKNLARHRDAAILINCTPVGVYPNCPAAPVSLEDFPALEGVADVNYNPLRTGLFMEAEARGIPCAGGLRMLVAQAKAAEERFFGKKIPEERIEEITAQLTREKENIVLIGMPGVGKSTTARALGLLTGRRVVDIDWTIAKDTGCTVPELFAREGEEAFRRRETETLRQYAKWSGVILACGGGVVTREENYPLLHQNGRIYELSRPLDSLATRNRPLSRDREALAALEEVRRPLYERFRDALIVNESSAQSAAERIWEDFCENSGH